MNSSGPTPRRRHRTAYALAIAVASLCPGFLVAQARMLPDVDPPPSVASGFAGGRLMRSGVLSEFDSLGRYPMGSIGDTVTVYVFPDGGHLGRVMHSRIQTRRRFLPPQSWRKACDEIAHPGWLFTITPTARVPFAVVFPGVIPAPTVRDVPIYARQGAWQFFHRVADSAWQQYLAFTHPGSQTGRDYLHRDFWGSRGDAAWGSLRMFGVHGPGRRQYAVFSFALHDDYPGNRPTTAGTWIVDAWGIPVATIGANIDVYGTIEARGGGGGDAIVTSSGLIRYDGTRWIFPAVYSEEPCLFHQVMNPPPGRAP